MIGKIKLSVLGLTLAIPAMMSAVSVTTYTYTFTLPQITIVRGQGTASDTAFWGITMTSQGPLVSAYTINPASITGGGPTNPPSTYLSSSLATQGSLYGPELFFSPPGANSLSFTLLGSAAFWSNLGSESFNNDDTTNAASWLLTSNLDPLCTNCSVNVAANLPVGTPEPQSLALLLVGLGAIAGALVLRRRSA